MISNKKTVSSHSIAEHRLNLKPTSCMSQSDILVLWSYKSYKVLLHIYIVIYTFIENMWENIYIITCAAMGLVGSSFCSIFSYTHTYILCVLCVVLFRARNIDLNKHLNGFIKFSFGVAFLHVILWILYRLEPISTVILCGIVFSYENTLMGILNGDFIHSLCWFVFSCFLLWIEKVTIIWS